MQWQRQWPQQCSEGTRCVVLPPSSRWPPLSCPGCLPGADVLGKGYQRPLELATLRLSNMTTVLSNCEIAWLAFLLCSLLLLGPPFPSQHHIIPITTL